ncbi:hypothetical protein C8F04DRAFT_1300599 [Mycena alexandri]|uniref:Uncharacterized protein n=1 Tax=Mycena alexandri TaxID=1745969 RepID=A0AAD6SCS8_9AGAR|nr:hypothetical protein C8F04DRAFT_1300599 [Mycena alexandri]
MSCALARGSEQTPQPNMHTSRAGLALSTSISHAPPAHHASAQARFVLGLVNSPLSTSSSALASSHDDSPLPHAGPWPAAFFAAFYAQVWCTYRAGFKPILDLPSLSSLPPPLSFPHTVSATANNSGTSLNSSTRQLRSSNGAVVPSAPGMKHLPSQSDSYSNSSGSGRGGGGGGGASRSTASHAVSASGSSYASSTSYASAQSGLDVLTGGTTWAKKNWFSIPLPRALSGIMGWTGSPTRAGDACGGRDSLRTRAGSFCTATLLRGGAFGKGTLVRTCRGCLAGCQWEADLPVAWTVVSSGVSISASRTSFVHRGEPICSAAMASCAFRLLPPAPPPPIPVARDVTRRVGDAPSVGDVLRRDTPRAPRAFVLKGRCGGALARLPPPPPPRDV